MPPRGGNHPGHPRQAPCASSAILKPTRNWKGAALWYEQRQPGLGDDFIDEFERTLRRIVATPERWRKIRGDNRKLNFHRFPYAIVYSVHGEVLRIKAVMHLHRRPAYWQHR